MKSPFPGMDPYLEAHWRDVHTRMMTNISDQIQEQLPDDLVARVEESVSVDYEDRSRSIAPDVRVVEDFEDAAMGFQSASVAVAAPLLVLEEVTETARHVQILEVSSGERVVTAIEVLSPTNKLTNAGRTDYRRKQQDYLDARVNLVEIDLLRGGEYVLAAALKRIPQAKRRLYMMSVQCRTTTKLFGASLREPLPVIPIPLRPKDRDVSLNIQQIINLVYERGRYAKLSYQADPEPPFSPEDAAWVDELLREHKRRN
ncbi:MAG: DUF4058 family protein [Planctomycetaceae bacterium]